MSTMIYNTSDDLKLISRTEINVDGFAAIRRLYEAPLVDPVTYLVRDIQYTYEVLVLNDADLYDFRMVTTNADEFEMYTEVADELVNTIVFQK